MTPQSDVFTIGPSVSGCSGPW